jgi:putative DNA methylase
MNWFCEEIKKAYRGRAPRVLDPFAGGGAIPLEAMRLGCEATAIDINPVGWFILKCTLEYPQKLVGQVQPLPKFAVESAEFMEAFFKGSGKLGKKHVEKELAQYQHGLFPPPEADLAWHVRAWGWWVLQQARKDLERFYPTIDGKPTVAFLSARTVTCKNCRATVPFARSAGCASRRTNESF